MNDTKPEVLPPIIIDAGKQRSKRIKQLGQNAGKLAERVQSAAEQVSAQAAEDPRSIIPVVLLVRRQSKRSKII